MNLTPISDATILHFYRYYVLNGPANLTFSCPKVLWEAYSNLKFGLWMHLGMVECHVLFTNHCDLKIEL